MISPQRPLRVEAEIPILIVGQMRERLWQFAVGCLEGLLRQFLRHPAPDARIERDGVFVRAWRLRRRTKRPVPKQTAPARFQQGVKFCAALDSPFLGRVCASW